MPPVDERPADPENDAPAPVENSHTSSAPPKQPAKHRITRPERIERWFEVVTASLLAVVAIATSWSIYQATRWAGVQCTDYAHAAALRVDSTRDATLDGQLRLYDLILVNNWINAHFSGNL